jgi:hypothetical protein
MGAFFARGNHGQKTGQETARESASFISSNAARRW